MLEELLLKVQWKVDSATSYTATTFKYNPSVCASADNLKRDGYTTMGSGVALFLISFMISVATTISDSAGRLKRIGLIRPVSELPIP